MNTLWPYASDDDIISKIKLVLSEMDAAADEVDIHRNVVDPFSAIFDMARLGIDFDEWSELEKTRQAQKSMQNAVGYFHQHILGCVDGWEDPGAGGGVDAKSDKFKVIAEIKNKHNTMNSSSAAETYRKMERFLDGTATGYMGYVVMVIPKNKQRFRRPFAPSVAGQRLPIRNDLELVDGATFYEIVTGDKDALSKLYKCLPDAINMATGGNAATVTAESNVSKLIDIFNRAF